jgi:hypothetical protein
MVSEVQSGNCSLKILFNFHVSIFSLSDSLGKNITKFDLPGQNPNIVFADGLDLKSTTGKLKSKR